MWTTPAGALPLVGSCKLSLLWPLPNPAPEERHEGRGRGLHPQPLPGLRELEHHLEVTHLVSHKGRLASLLILS